MGKLIVVAIALGLLGIIIEIMNEKEKGNKKEYLYTPLKGPLTKTEIKFVKTLEEITKKYNLIIMPQVQMQKILKANDKDIAAFNKIKAKTIDFAILDNEYNYKMFIELDDYTHNYKRRIERDNFINDVMRKNNLNLKRIKVEKEYNKEKLEEYIREVI